jgi:intracellular septation protein
MMRKVNPIVKLVLELGPVVAFFIAFGRVKDQTFTIAGTEYSGFIAVTAGFIGLIILTSGILWALTGKLSKMQIMTLVLVVVMGGLSVWLNDPQFIKMKPTLLYLFFGGVLAVGLLQGKSYLKAVMEEAMPLEHEGWMILTQRLAVFFFALAVANEVVWRMMSTEVWVNFKTFGLTFAVFGFFMAQGKILEKYAINDGPKS